MRIFVPCSLLPTPYSPLPVPYSLLPVPCSQIRCSLCYITTAG
ncbi:hypothetical protein [Moorena sp. SIOASIH]|nr:hypothetical protein [Moorena sp. SIOASIH]